MNWLKIINKKLFNCVFPKSSLHAPEEGNDCTGVNFVVRFHSFVAKIRR